MKIKFAFVLVAMAIVTSATFTFAGQIEDMQDELAMKISMVKRYHKKNSKNLVTAAQDEIFKKYFSSTDAAEKKQLKAKIDQISLSVQSKFKVDEMCLIDKSGLEISRIVYREIAPDKDLSSEEASADFFKPSFAKSAKKAHVSAPYMSADSLRWVICYATPIVLDDGSKPGIYHYEMPLYALQNLVNRDIEGNDTFILLVTPEGYLTSDSRKKFKLELNPADKEMEAPMGDYFTNIKDTDLASLAPQLTPGAEGTATVSLAGAEYQIAFAPFGYADWTAVMASKK